MGEPGFKECPVCAEPIREKAKLCRFCGAVLTEEPLPRIASREERVAAAGSASDGADEGGEAVEASHSDLGERLTLRSRQKLESVLLGAEDQYRSATVLFVDVVGYTALCEKLRAEETKDILDSYYAVCAHVVDFFNGFILEFQGDGCLAVFGAPVAYERDAECAVRAALEIRDRVRALPPIHGMKIRVSAGVETGNVLSSVIRSTTPPTYKVFGTPINLASRVRGAAGPDRILIGPETRELVKDAFRLQRKRAQRFKNIEHPVVTYEVLGALPATAVARRDFEVPFFGRERELERMRGAWERWRSGAAGAPAALLLTGEPGIGKTRLMMEFLRRLESGRALRVEGAPYGAKVPWAMWRSLVLQILGEPAPEVGTGGRNWPAYSRALERLGYRPAEQLSLLALLGDPRAVEQLGALSPAAVRRLLHADLRTLLERSAAGRPLVLVLDDLQWSDRTSLDALAALMAQPPEKVIFFLAHRGDFDLALPQGAAVEPLALRGLDVKSRQQLFSVLADVREVLPEIQDRLVHQEAGNPFYMMELVRSLVQRPPADSGGGEEEKELPLGRVRDLVPASLVEILQARIDGLDQRRKLVLQCAAVLGKRFTVQFLEFFDFIQEGLLARLYSLKSLRMLDDTITVQGLEFFFLHHVTREVSYRTLLDRQRRDLHLFVAREIEKRYPDTIDDHAPVLAYHYLQADDGRAVPYLKTTADRAAALGAIPEALESYGEAVARLRAAEKATPASRKLLAQILRAMGRLHRYNGDPARAEELLAEAIACCQKGKDRRGAQGAMVERGLLRVQTGDYAAAETDFSAALDSNGSSHSPAKLRPEAMNGLGMCGWGRGDLAQARAHLEQAAAALPESGAPPALIAAIYNNLGLVDWRQGELRRALRTIKEALRHQRQAGDKFGIAATVMNLGIIEENLGNLAAAERRYREALELAQRIRYQQIVTACHANLANRFLAENLAADALTHSGMALEVAERIGDRRSAAIALENLALSHLGLKQFRDTQKRLREAAVLAEELGDNERRFSLDLVDLELALAQGKFARLGARLTRAEKALIAGGFEAERPRLHRLMALSHWGNQEQDAAAEAARQALAVARRQHNRTEEARAHELLASFGEA